MNLVINAIEAINQWNFSDKIDKAFIDKGSER